MQNSGLGDIRNLRISSRKTLEDLIYLSPEDRLKCINEFEPTEELLNRIPFVIPGDTSDLILNIVSRRIPLLLENTDINKDIIFVNDFYKRYNMVDEINTRKHMSISLSDLFEQRLQFLKRQDKVKYHGYGHLTPDKEMNFYKQLVEIFIRDKKTLVTLIRIYPQLIQAIEDSDLAKIIYSEVLADIIKDNISPTLVMNVLSTFLIHLENISENSEDSDWFITNECSFYIRRIIYSMNDIHELHPFIIYCYNAYSKTTSNQFKKMYIKTFSILQDIIKDAIGNDFKNKYKDITSISLNALIDRIQLVRGTINMTRAGGRMVSNNSIFAYMNTLGEILNNYNKLFADSDIMQGTLSEANNEYATTLLDMCLDETPSSRYKHITEYMKYAKQLIVDVEPELMKFVNMTLSKLSKNFENGRTYILEKIKSKGISVKEMKDGGFLFTDGSFASYTDVLNENTRRIKSIYPTLKDMLNMIIDARYSMSAKDMMRELVITADIVGRAYNGNDVQNIFSEGILRYNKEEILNKLCISLFGFPIDKVDLSRLYNIEYANKLLKTKVQVVNYKNIVSKLDLDTFYRLGEITISDNIGVEDEDNMPLFIEDLDFSEYDFGDSILIQEVDIFDLSVFQVLRQITANNLNLLTTNLAEEHDLYLSVIQMMEDVLS